MIWPKLVFGGFGRRGLEAVIAVGVLVFATAIVAGSLMIVQGARTPSHAPRAAIDRMSCR